MPFTSLLSSRCLSQQKESTFNRSSCSCKLCSIAVQFKEDLVWHLSMPEVPSPFWHDVAIACWSHQLHHQQLSEVLSCGLTCRTSLTQHTASVSAEQSIRDGSDIGTATSLDLTKTNPSTFRCDSRTTALGHAFRQHTKLLQILTFLFATFVRELWIHEFSVGVSVDISMRKCCCHQRNQHHYLPALSLRPCQGLPHLAALFTEGGLSSPTSLQSNPLLTLHFLRAWLFLCRRVVRRRLLGNLPPLLCALVSALRQKTTNGVSACQYTLFSAQSTPCVLADPE